MIYPTKSFSKKKRIGVKNFSGGVNLRELPNGVEDNQCSKIKNMWFKDGVLKNRPAMRIDENKKLFDDETTRAFWHEFKIFGAQITPESQVSRLVMLSENYDSLIRYKFFIVDKDGSVKNAASIDFNRTSFDMFSIPHVNNVFYEESKTGSGIFMMITMYNYESSNSNARVNFYELSSDYSVWNNVTKEKLYVPTVYINGRGNNYGVLLENLYTESPKFVESLSMLTGEFKTYFGSDSVSHTFTLPINRLDNNDVTCKLNYLGEEYFWRVGPYETYSQPVEILNEEIKMMVDREGGKITFYSGNTPFALPMYNYNNMEIRAFKTDKTYIESLKNSKVFCEYNSRTFISGFINDANAVYYSEESNPFYFPRRNKLHLGSAVQGVTTLCVHEKLLIAFKESKTYSIFCKKVGSYNIEEIISNTEEKPAVAKVSVDVLSEEMGCDCVNTILNCGNHLVWLSSTGKVCTIIVSNQYSKGNVYELSINIEDFLRGRGEDSLKNAVACIKNGYYVIFIDNIAVAMDYNVKGFRYVSTCTDQKSANRNIYWYLWEFDEKTRVMNAFSHFDDCVLITSRMSDDTFWYGTAKLEGEKDCIPRGSFGGLEIGREPMSCFIKTKNFDFGEMGNNKFLKKAYLSIKNAGSVTVTFFDGEEEKDTKIFTASKDKLTTKELYFLNPRCTDISLSVETVGETQIGSLQIEAVVTEN